MAAKIADATRRRKERARTAGKRILRICVEEDAGRPRWLTGDLFDYSEVGLGISLALPLSIGSVVSVRGRFGENGRKEVSNRARVIWCLEHSDGTYRAGLEYDGPHEGSAHYHMRGEAEAPAPDAEEDYYEVLQISCNADQETVHRVFRMLAQRYHPDNRDSGNEEAFKRVVSAYRVLSNPEERAAYDAKHAGIRRRRWRIFDQAQAPAGVEAERRKRSGILSLLYAQRINDPDRPFVTIHELEDVLGCPRYHLQVSLWYLKEKGYIGRTDDGRYLITCAGVDAAEADGEPGQSHRRLLKPAKIDAAG